MELKDLYVELGFPGQEKLYYHAKEHGYKMKQVKEFLKKQEVAQLHKPIGVAKSKAHILSFFLDSRWQADLIDMQQYSHANAGYKWILVIVDVFSRYGWTFKLKNKEGKSVSVALAELFETVHPALLESDNGPEFLNRDVKAVLTKHNVILRPNYAGDHRTMSVVERLNYTIKSMITKRMTAFDTKKWIDVLEPYTAVYNRTKHSTLKMTPKEARINTDEVRDLWLSKSLSKDEIEELVDQKVRHAVEKKTFDKGYLPKFSKNIREVEAHKGTNYTLKGMDKPFRRNELQVIGEVEKVEKREDLLHPSKRTREPKDSLVLPFVPAGPRKSSRESKPVQRDFMVEFVD